MKDISYTTSLFKKAIKRNFPKLIHLIKKDVKGYNVYEFWFVTQKAIISHVEPVKRSVEILMDELLNYGYIVEPIDNNRLEFVKYE